MVNTDRKQSCTAHVKHSHTLTENNENNIFITRDIVEECLEDEEPIKELLKKMGVL